MWYSRKKWKGLGRPAVEHESCVHAMKTGLVSS